MSFSTSHHPGNMQKNLEMVLQKVATEIRLEMNVLQVNIDNVNINVDRLCNFMSSLTNRVEKQSKVQDEIVKSVTNLKTLNEQRWQGTPNSATTPNSSISTSNTSMESSATPCSVSSGRPIRGSAFQEEQTEEDSRWMFDPLPKASIEHLGSIAYMHRFAAEIWEDNKRREKKRMESALKSNKVIVTEPETPVNSAFIMDIWWEYKS